MRNKKLPQQWPKGTLPQDISHTRRASSAMRVPLTTWHPFYPGRQPSQAHQADSNEDRSPTVICHQQAGPSVPAAGPSFIPAMIAPLANPRECSGRCRVRILQYHGNATDSPVPRISRIRSNIAKPCTIPVAAVESDHTR